MVGVKLQLQTGNPRVKLYRLQSKVHGQYILQDIIVRSNPFDRVLQRLFQVSIIHGIPIRLSRLYHIHSLYTAPPLVESLPGSFYQKVWFDKQKDMSPSTPWPPFCHLHLPFTYGVDGTVPTVPRYTVCHKCWLASLTNHWPAGMALGSYLSMSPIL